MFWYIAVVWSVLVCTVIAWHLIKNSVKCMEYKINRKRAKQSIICVNILSRSELEIKKYLEKQGDVCLTSSTYSSGVTEYFIHFNLNSNLTLCKMRVQDGEIPGISHNLSALELCRFVFKYMGSYDYGRNRVITELLTEHKNRLM